MLPTKILNSLNQRQTRFVAEYVKDGDGTRSAREAGYTFKHAKQIAYQLTHRNAAVRAAIDSVKAEVARRAEYNADKAMQESSDAMALAVTTENANAFVAAVTLRAKLNGLLIERSDVRMLGGFHIRIQGLE